MVEEVNRFFFFMIQKVKADGWHTLEIFERMETNVDGVDLYKHGDYKETADRQWSGSRLDEQSNYTIVIVGNNLEDTTWHSQLDTT